MQCAHEPLYDIEPQTGIALIFQTARWKRSAEAALVGFTGPAVRVLCQTARRLGELRSVSACDECDGGDQALMHERLANKASYSMCHACDMEQPTHDDTCLESLVFTSIF